MSIWTTSYTKHNVSDHQKWKFQRRGMLHSQLDYSLHRHALAFAATSYDTGRSLID